MAVFDDRTLVRKRTAASTRHPDYSALAGRLVVASIHKVTPKLFSAWVAAYGSGNYSLFNPEFVELVKRVGPEVDGAIVHSRDFALTYPSIRTMAHTYLMRCDGRVIERPQHMYMRVALAAHGSNIDLVLQTYDALSRRLFTPASPVLFNAGTQSRQYASCYLYKMNSDIATTPLESAHDLDVLWLADGGIGMSLAEVPAKRPHPGAQPGIMSLMRVYDTHAEYTGLSRRARPSALTVYLPIWHADVRPFILARTNQAARMRVWHVYPALWIPDIFMHRLREGGSWSLFDPVAAPLLLASYGPDFSQAYEMYERTTAPADHTTAYDIWNIVSRAQQETGTPFILYQDAVNSKNNQAHLGMIHSSNLCTEIVQYCSTEDTAVCTLASIALPRFVRPDGSYDHEGLHEVAALAVRTTNAFVDRNDYPSESTRLAAMDTRAIGIGTQGLADTFMACNYSFDSAAARKLNRDIFETIYHAAYQTSTELAELDGPYRMYPNSPADHGTLQHDMWTDTVLSGRYDFDALRSRISLYGLRNSMLTAQMPTASTAKLLGNFDSIEPYTSNVITHRTLSGDYTEFCPWLVRELNRRGLWTEDIRVAILRHHGSIQSISDIPLDVKVVYRTAWEIEPKVCIDLAADRGPFIDQSQSLSLNVRFPSTDLLRDLQLHAWARGLKTGVYYLRTQAPAFPLAFGLVTPTGTIAPKHATQRDSLAVIAVLEGRQPTARSVLTPLNSGLAETHCERTAKMSGPKKVARILSSMWLAVGAQKPPSMRHNRGSTVCGNRKNVTDGMVTTRTLSISAAPLFDKPRTNQATASTEAS
ncbi:hypothetical protein K466DRAFT_574464 [Polyporus arcularius HHB13444]|uniref:Ribonucleoside-diphosphate reductase n=1 Tax=Polyporus arcularius HHB13444 TaxID=1314778 RepID=A0A5C3PKG5_9APHY|nr:hypothetical protein K466DRAFT_574464 [Polyporus arcularius HHB13444]